MAYGYAFRFPGKCCVCSGRAETTYKISRSHGFGSGQITTHAIEVPICFPCASKQKIKKILIPALIIGIAALIGMFIWKEDQGMGYSGSLLLGGFFGVLLVAFFEHKLGPAEVAKGGTRIRFHNADYDKLFRELNNL